VIFLELVQARICYKERWLTFRHAGLVIHKKLGSLPDLESGAHQEVGVGNTTLPARTELRVQLPVSAGSRIGDGLVEKAEIVSRVSLAESLFNSTIASERRIALRRGPGRKGRTSLTGIIGREPI
jgi:hypothetical protein